MVRHNQVKLGDVVRGVRALSRRSDLRADPDDMILRKAPFLHILLGASYREEQQGN